MYHTYDYHNPNELALLIWKELYNAKQKGFTKEKHLIKLFESDLYLKLSSFSFFTDRLHQQTMFWVLFPMELSPIKRVMVQSAKEAVR